jgi:hypothetical protein
MRQLLGRLGIRVGAVLAIVVVIGIAVAIGRAVGDNNRPPTSLGGEGGEPPVTASGASSTGPDDGVQRPAPTLSATPIELKIAVDQFMIAWLDRNATPEAWHAAVAKLATTRLSASLIGVDPLGVPATRVVNPPTFPILTATFARATIGVDSGTVTLTLLKQYGVWRVDGIDWQRA